MNPLNITAHERQALNTITLNGTSTEQTPQVRNGWWGFVFLEARGQRFLHSWPQNQPDMRGWTSTLLNHFAG